MYFSVKFMVMLLYFIIKCSVLEYKYNMFTSFHVGFPFLELEKRKTD